MPSVSYRFDRSGPILDFRVGVSEPRRKILKAQGLEVPPPTVVTFIVDTGADTTMIEEQYMRSLGIPSTGGRPIVSSTTPVGTGGEWCETYDISLTLAPPGEDIPFYLPILETFGRPLHAGAIEGMIGRDVLRHLTFVIEGKHSRFRLEY